MSQNRPSIPTEMKRAVRRRCGFGCVVCGLPIFEYDHMIEFAKVQTHEVDNLTLLCPNHHSEKTAGLLSQARLASANANPFNKLNSTTAPWKRFLFSGNLAEIFIGGNTYSYDFVHSEEKFFDVINIGGKSLLGVRFDGEGLLLSGLLTDKRGQNLLIVDDGEMKVSTEVFDYEPKGAAMCIRSASKSVELELKFEGNRLSITKGYFFQFGGLVIVDGNKQVIEKDGKPILSISECSFSGTPRGIVV
jgi:hypothetical protein